MIRIEKLLAAISVDVSVFVDVATFIDVAVTLGYVGIIYVLGDTVGSPPLPVESAS